MTTQMTQYNHPGVALIQADTLATLMQDWLDNLHERVGAQEISADTAAGYDRGVTKFLNWLQDREPNPNAIRSWKAELLKAGTRALRDYPPMTRGIFGQRMKPDTKPPLIV